MEFNTHQQNQRLLERQLDLLSQSIGPTLLGGSFILFFLVFLLKDFFASSGLYAWAFIGGAIMLARYAFHIHYWKQCHEIKKKNLWLRIQFLGTLMSGATWGYAAIYFIPEQPIYMAVMIILYGGLTAVNTATYASVRGLSACFIVPMLTPLSLHMMMLMDTPHMVIGIATFIFMLIMLITSEHLYQAVVQSLRAGIINEDMSIDAIKSRTETEQLNSMLHAEIEGREKIKIQIEKSEYELNRILENMQDTYYRTDVKGQIIKVSSSVKALLGYEPKELIGEMLTNFYRQPEDREKFLGALKQSNGKIKNYTAPFRKKDKSIVWVSTNAQYLHNEDGEIIGVEGTTRDISALKIAERALFEEKEKAEVTLRSIGDGVITTDINGRVDYMNPVAEELTGWTRGKAHGKYLSEIASLSREGSSELLQNIFSEACSLSDESQYLDSDMIMRNHLTKEDHSVEITISDLKDSKGECRGSVMVFHDVSKLRGMAREMSYQATHDSLTGLINRAEFERRLLAAIQNAADDTHLQHALMYMDLDQFKVVNDTCGHIAGDELLKQLTVDLQTGIRGNDILARLGGDEFGVLLTNCSLEKARTIAEKLRDMAQKFHFTWDGKVLEIGVSIGLVAINSDTADLTSVLSSADSACYVAKDLGRNRVHIFDHNDEEVALRHGQMQWIQRIKQALDEDRIVLYCQKAVAINSHATAGFYNEILMRMIDEDHKLISPAIFILAAERYNLMPAIDRRVVSAALQYYAKDSSLSENDVIAINLSGQSLADETFLQFMIDQLEFSGIPAERVCLEITETAAIANLTQATHLMSVLRKMGCRFALDDFGSGLSSFAYLKRMPVDFLKIDGEFIRNIDKDPVHYAMVESINHIGHVFGMQTIAEFVENDEILSALEKMGVDYAQGYGVSKPIALTDS